MIHVFSLFAVTSESRIRLMNWPYIGDLFVALLWKPLFNKVQPLLILLFSPQAQPNVLLYYSRCALPQALFRILAASDLEMKVVWPKPVVLSESQNYVDATGCNQRLLKFKLNLRIHWGDEKKVEPEIEIILKVCSIDEGSPSESLIEFKWRRNIQIEVKHFPYK